MTKLRKYLILLASVATSIGMAAAADLSYPKLVEGVRGYLGSLGEGEVFAIVEEETGAGTTIRFINGNKADKADHATPLRVTIRIARGDEGRPARYRVRAREEGIVFSRRDRRAEERWRGMLGERLAGGG